MTTLQQLLSIRSQAVEACLEYLRGLETALLRNPLLEHAGKTLAGPLRIPLECRLHDTRKVEEELEQREKLRLEGVPDEGQLHSQQDDPELSEEQRRERRELEEKLRPRPLSDIAKEKRDLVVLGDPGAGKSEWCRHEALAVSIAQREALEKGSVLDGDIRLPVWLTLPELAAALNAGERKLREFYEKTLASAVAAGLGRRRRRGEAQTSSDFPPWTSLDETALTLLRVLRALQRRTKTQGRDGRPDAAQQQRWRSRVLVKLWRDWRRGTPAFGSSPASLPAPVFCLDAWDEVRADADRDRVKETLPILRDSLAPQGYRFRLSSRVAGYDAGLGKEDDTFEILPLARGGIRKFLHEFFTGDPVTANHLAAELEAKPAIAGLAENPLMLTLLALAFTRSASGRKRIELPARRVEIFDAVLVDLLGGPESERKKKAGPNMTLVRQKRAALRAIAWHFWPRQLLAGEELEAFCDSIQNSSQIGPVLKRSLKKKGNRTLYELFTQDDPMLVPFGADYRFLHLTIQECLVAGHLATAVNEDGWNHATVEFKEQGFPRQQVRMAHLLDRKSWLAAWRQIVLLVAGKLEDPFPLLTLFVRGQALALDPCDDLLRHRLSLAASACGEIGPERWRKAGLHRRWLESVGEWMWSHWHRLHEGRGEKAFAWLSRALGTIAGAQHAAGFPGLSGKFGAALRAAASGAGLISNAPCNCSRKPGRRSFGRGSNLAISEGGWLRILGKCAGRHSPQWLRRPRHFGRRSRRKISCSGSRIAPRACARRRSPRSAVRLPGSGNALARKICPDCWSTPTGEYAPRRSKCWAARPRRSGWRRPRSACSSGSTTTMPECAASL